MALIRWKAMRSAQSGMMKPRSAWRILACIAFAVAILCVPTYLVHEVRNVSPSHADFFTVDISEWARRNRCTYFKANLWIIGIVLKAIPCILLLGFTLSLMIRLQKNNAKRALLLYGGSGGGGGGSGNSTPSGSRAKKRQSNYDRTTLTLIVMLTVFLLTELPQGILTMLNGIYTNDVHTVFYMNLANVLDLLSLINCYVGFIAYCFLCSKYRQTFKLLLIGWAEKANLATTIGTATTNDKETVGASTKLVADESGTIV